MHHHSSKVKEMTDWRLVYEKMWPNVRAAHQKIVKSMTTMMMMIMDRRHWFVKHSFYQRFHFALILVLTLIGPVECATRQFNSKVFSINWSENGMCAADFHSNDWNYSIHWNHKNFCICQSENGFYNLWNFSKQANGSTIDSDETIHLDASDSGRKKETKIVNIFMYIDVICFWFFFWLCRYGTKFATTKYGETYRRCTTKPWKQCK